MQLRRSGTYGRRPGHHDDVTRRKAWDERPDGLAKPAAGPVADDGAADPAAHGETYARLVRCFPREMVQDELGAGHASALTGTFKVPWRTQTMLTAHASRMPGYANDSGARYVQRRTSTYPQELWKTWGKRVRGS